MKNPTLFDARYNGVYSFSTVLNNHKEFDASPFVKHDGIVYLCENGKLDAILAKRDYLRGKIAELEAGQIGQPYGVWTVLDREAHFYRTRLQLVMTCIDYRNKEHI